MDSNEHTWDCSSKVDFASSRRVFPDSVMLGARLNLSWTRLKLKFKLGVEIALCSAVCNFFLFLPPLAEAGGD